MKRHLLLMMMPMLAFALASCQNEPKNENGPEIEVRTNSLTFAATGAQEQSVRVYADGVAWRVNFDQESAPWLHVTQKTNWIAVSVDDNDTLGERQATFLIEYTGGDPIEISVKQSGFGLVRAIGDYFMAPVRPEMGVLNLAEFIIGFSSMELDAHRSPTTDGFVILLDLLVPRQTQSKTPEIPTGTYSTGLDLNNIDPNTNTWLLGGSQTDNCGIQYYEMVEVPYEDTMVEIAVKTRSVKLLSGSVDVSKSGNNYTVVFDLAFEDGTTYNTTWTGPIETTNQDFLSTFEDSIDTTMRGGGGIFNAWGEMRSDVAIDGSWDWDIWFFGEDLTFPQYGEPVIINGEEHVFENHNPWGVGDLMRVTIVADPLTPADDITLLPVGTFPIGGMCTRNTSLWGGWENNAKVYTGIWGSWYIDYNDIMRYPDRDEPKMAALIGGTVEIEYNPDTKIYNIVVDAFSDAGQPIKVDFEGPIRPDVSFIKFD